MVHFLILFVFFLWWVFSPSMLPNWHQFTLGYANTGLWVIRAVIQPPRDKNHFGSHVKLHHHCLNMPGLCLMVVIYSASSQGVVCVHFVIALLAQWESPRFSELPFVCYETYSHWQWSQGQFFIFSWSMMIYVSIRAVCLGSSSLSTCRLDNMLNQLDLWPSSKQTHRCSSWWLYRLFWLLLMMV